jgi:hypothetical protein
MMKLKNILFEAHKLVKVVGGYPVRYEGDPRNYRAIISEPMNDRQKTDMIKRAKQAGYRAKPNMGGGVTIFVKEGKLNEALPKFKSLVQAFDYIQGLRGQSMDLEQTMRSTLADIQDLQKDMEQEAEPEGGPIADKYAREMEYLKRQYNKTKAEFERVMDEVDEFDQKYL